MTENEKEYTIIEFCNGRKIAVKNNTPQANQTLDDRCRTQEDNILGTFTEYLRLEKNDYTEYSKKEKTDKFFENVDKNGLLDVMFNIYNSYWKHLGDLDGVNCSAIPYTEDTLFEVK